MVVLTLKPMCFSQAAQGNLHTPVYSSPTHTKDGAAGEQRVDRWVGAQSPQPHGLWRQSHCPFPGGPGPQQSLDLSLELSKSPSHLAPAAPQGPLSPLPGTRSHQQPGPWAQRLATAQLLQTPNQSPLMPSMFWSTLTKELCHPFLKQISRSC